MLCCFPLLLQYCGVLFFQITFQCEEVETRWKNKKTSNKSKRQTQRSGRSSPQSIPLRPPPPPPPPPPHTHTHTHTHTHWTYGSTSVALTVAATCTAVTDFVAMAYNNEFLCLFHEDLIKIDTPPCLDFDLPTQHDMSNMWYPLTSG